MNLLGLSASSNSQTWEKLPLGRLSWLQLLHGERHLLCQHYRHWPRLKAAS